MTSPHYEIQIEGYLGDSWSDWFEGLAVHRTTDASGEYMRTILSGAMDQAMLHGVLLKICNLGLPLISLCRTNPPSQLDRCDDIGAKGQ